MSIILSSQPNYKVTIAHYATDPNPFVAYVQENSVADAIYTVLNTMENLDVINGYVQNNFGTVDGSPEHPEDWCETEFGWIQSDLIVVQKVANMNDVCTVMTPECLIPYLDGSISDDNITETGYKSYHAFCDELLDSHIVPKTCKPIKYMDKYVETEPQIGADTLVLCEYRTFKENT